MTLDPAQQQPTTSETPPVSGGVNPEQSQAQAAPAETTPLFVANTQDELNAKFGSVRDEGRLSAAKAAGFDSVEAMNAAMQTYWQYVQTGEIQTTAQPATPATPADPGKPTTPAAEASTSTPPSDEVRNLRLDNAAQRQALALGADPTKLDAVLALRAKSPADFDAAGNANPEVVNTSLAAVLEAHPYFKAAPRTIGSGSNPVIAAPPTIDAQIQEAQSKGDWQKVVILQTQKLTQAPAQK